MIFHRSIISGKRWEASGTNGQYAVMKRGSHEYVWAVLRPNSRSWAMPDQSKYIDLNNAKLAATEFDQLSVLGSVRG
jgi:hypothetical protein